MENTVTSSTELWASFLVGGGVYLFSIIQIILHERGHICQNKVTTLPRKLISLQLFPELCNLFAKGQRNNLASSISKHLLMKPTHAEKG